ncbi:RecT family protein [Streptomyces griseofuscus]|uniref:RecT family protein n=1 Tax=Streptomyces griseofuscus TaxID=146922 RepID=A0A7H1Q3G5_9ACTN|nr:RecT family recombinase [Streptomyces griseofuscus]QNT94845.1 RecT family protein [Streptomyces griseofuscus]
MSTALKDRLRAARQASIPASAGPGEEHGQAPDSPAELVDIKGHEQVEPAMSATVMEWLNVYRSHFEGALPACVDSAAFFAAVRSVLPTLAKCKPASVLQTLLTCARFGLIPDGHQAAITRQGTTAAFVPMYQGYIELMYRSGLVESVHVGVIREQDEFDYVPTAKAPEDFVHRPNLRLSQKERGEVVIAYAYAWLKNGARSQVILLTREDAEEIRDEYSESYRRAEETEARDSYWHRFFQRMWEKSAIRRLIRVVPKSAELRALADADDAGDRGQVQILHAPDTEAARLLVEAERAHTAAEASQDIPPAPAKARPLKKRRQPRRSTRAARKGRK